MAKKSTGFPGPVPTQPHHAGDTESKAGSRVTYLAPRPLPTGYARGDYLKGIGELNDTWLDYGVGWPKVFGWQLMLGGVTGICLIMGVLFPLVSAALFYSEASPFLVELAAFAQITTPATLFGGGGLALIATFVVIHTHQEAKRAIPVRFNRQRREVCFTPQDGQGGHGAPVIVPWESLMAWVVQARGATSYGVMQQYSLGFGYAHSETDEWIRLEFETPGLPAAIGSWEALRAYMEYEIDSFSELEDLEGLRGPDDPPYEGVHTLRAARRRINRARRSGEVGWLFWLCWYVIDIVELWNLPGYLAEWQTRRLKKSRPKLRPAEVEAWSQPLPKEQWAKPSEELVRLSAEVNRLRQRDPHRPIEEIFAEASRRQGIEA